MSAYVTISEAAEMFGVSRRLLHYMAYGRPGDDSRNDKKPTLKKIKYLPYGQKTMYLLNVDELTKHFGERK